ncbi:GNAT family N-acetyltransferase [Alteriqipengyuania sp. 357]
MVLVDTRLEGTGGCAPQFAVAPWRDAMPDAAQWDALSCSASEPNPFFERWFLTPSLEAFDAKGDVRLAQLHVDGRLVGLVPLRYHSSYYYRPVPHLAVWLHDNAFCGVPLIAPGFEAMFWDKLLRWADAHGGLAAFLHLPGLPLGCASDTALAELTRDTARTAAVVGRTSRALLASDLAPEDYYNEYLPNKKRKELRRQARRLAEEGEVSVERAHSPEDIARFAEEYLALEAASWKGSEGSALAMDDAHARFFRESLIGAARQGRAEGLSLRLDGKAVATLAIFLAPPGSFTFKTAFDGRYARFSPGVLLQKENLDLLARDGIEWCDSCAAPDHPMIDHFWRGQRELVARNIAIGGTVRRALGARLIDYESQQFARKAVA